MKRKDKNHFKRLEFFFFFPDKSCLQVYNIFDKYLQLQLFCKNHFSKIMKYFILILAIFVATSIANANDDDDDDGW